MGRPLSKSARRTAFRVFAEQLQRGEGVAAAAHAAGVSERTGRRWRTEVPLVLRRADSGGSPEPELTSFHGRETDLEALAGLFGGSCRLVTLLGPPGMGKTRLAQRVLASLPEDSVFCDLRAVRTASELCEEVARVLDLRLGQGQERRDLEADVGRALAARRRCLVVLDNFEQIEDAGSACISAWLCAAPDARILVTTRRVLRVTGEHVYELGPLEFAPSEERRESEALSLFLARARAAEPAFDANAAVVEASLKLVSRLEGVPLAIELAAGQMRRTDPATLRERLDAAPLEMERVVTDGDPRHASMRDAIRSSWALLSPCERAVLSQLTVFRGGFTAEAAGAVLELSEWPDASADEALAALRETSLLRAVEGTRARRWDMYEAIREFASEQLDARLRDGLQGRHASHFAGRPLPWPYDETKTPSHELLERLGDDYDNLRAAFDHLARVGSAVDTAALARLGMMLHAVLAGRMPSIAAAAVTRVLEMVGSKSPPLDAVILAQLHLARAESRRAIGAYDDARADLQKAGALSTAEALSARIECEAGMVAFESGDIRKARGLAESALAKAAAWGCRATQAYVHRFLGYVLTEVFNDRAGFAHFDRAIVLAECTGDERLKVTSQLYSCVFRLRFGDASAVPVASALLEHRHAVRDDPYWQTTLLIGLGWWHQDQGEFDAALDRYNSAKEIAGSHGLRYQEACALFNRGLALEEKGDRRQAHLAYAGAEAEFAAIQAPRLLALVRLHRGGLWVQEGEVVTAETCLSASECALRDLGEPDLLSAIGWLRSRIERPREPAPERTRALQSLLREGWEGPPVQESGVLENRALLETNLSARVIWRTLFRERWLGSCGQGVRVVVDGSGFQRDSEQWVSLASRPVMRRVLSALALARTESSETVSHDELLRRGWPDEQMLEDAGIARLRAVVARLRRLGLGAAVITSESGYALSPEVSVVNSPADPATSFRIG